MFFVCMLMPASISILVEKKIIKKKMDNSDLILKYLFYTFLITTVMNTLFFIFDNDRSSYYTSSTFTYDFCIKYTWISLLISAVIPYILKVISANININLEIKEKSKDEKTKVSKKRSTKKSLKNN